MADPRQIVLRHVIRRIAKTSIAKTYTVNKGDAVWYGKYKNQRGLVKNFGMGDKGDPTITVEQLPAPSARKPKKKSPKELKLFNIRPRAVDKEAKALSKREVPKADGSGTTTIYEYGPRQVAQRAKKKAVRIEALRQKMSDLRKGFHDDLTSQDPQTRLTALGISLMDETYARVGNVVSAKNGHHGVTNWTVAHVTLNPKSATIKYTGKSGVKQEKKVTNARVLSALRQAVSDKSADDKILCDGDECDVLAKDINAYLRPFGITAKDIRGMHANEEMKKHLRAQRKAGPSLPRSRKDKDKILKAEFKAALALASAAVGHKDSTLRNQYLVPSMEASYTHDGTVLDRLDKKATLSDPEKEDRESARLVRQSPKFKPPRRDKERGRVKDTGPDTDPDEAQDQKDRSRNYKDAAARVALRYLIAAKPKKARGEKVPMYNTEADRVVLVTPETAKADSGKYKEPTEEQLEATSPDAASDAADKPEADKPEADAPLTRSQRREMVNNLSEGLAQGSRSTLRSLPEMLLRDIAEAMGDPAKAVVDALAGDMAALEALATGAKELLGKIPKADEPTKAQVSAADALLTKHGDAGGSLESLEDDLSDLRDEAPDPADTEGTKKHRDAVTELAAQVKAFKAAEKTIEAQTAWKAAPGTQDIANALVALRAVEIRKDPLLLDLAKPLTTRSTEPLNLEGGAQKAFIAKMGDITVDTMGDYRSMPQDKRQAHKDGLEAHLEKLGEDGHKDTEQFHATKAQLRGLQMASALEDGDEAKGINPTFQTMLKAAEAQGSAILDKFVKLNVTGAAEGDVGAQMQMRNLLRDAKALDLRKLLAEDHPAQVALEAMTGGHLEGKQKELWMKNMDSESLEMLQELAEDMILEDILFTDMDLVRAGKTTGQVKKDGPSKKRKQKKQQGWLTKTKSILDQLRAKWKTNAAGVGSDQAQRQSPAAKKSDHNPLHSYDFAPWGAF